MSLQIGSTVLVFDSNHRVYARDKPYGGPIYREHFVPREIVGETSRSWILLGGRKISKATLEGIFTPEQADDLAWADAHRYKIREVVWGIKDVHVLREVAKLIGYQEEAR